MKFAYFTSQNKKRIAIPVNKIVGFTETSNEGKSLGECFIATGPDSEFADNGWYVSETFEEVKHCLEAITGD